MKLVYFRVFHSTRPAFILFYFGPVPKKRIEDSETETVTCHHFRTLNQYDIYFIG